MDKLNYNVVLIISDQHRRDALGCYGNLEIKTPNIDRLAEKGVVFSKAYCASPLCAPTRASLHTGKYPCNHKALYHKSSSGGAPGSQENKGIRGQETMGQSFRQKGYITGAIGKMHVHGETREDDLGFDERSLRFYTYNMEDYIEAVGQEKVDTYLGDVYTDKHFAYNTNNTPATLENKDIFDTLVTNSALDFIDHHKDEKFFLHIGLEKPHAPWKTEQHFHDMYTPNEMVLPSTCHERQEKGKLAYLPEWIQGDGSITEDEMRNSIAAYYANVTALDENVGKIINEIERHGLTEKTIIIYTSDHGENLYDHGLIEKHCFYEGAVGIPLIISCPEYLPMGTQCDVLTSTIDIFPTLEAITGHLVTPGLEGVSLLQGIQGKFIADREIYSEFYEHFPQRMLLTKEWKYVYTEGSDEQLYNVLKDPLEIMNLAADDYYQTICKELREKTLKGWNYTLT